MYYKISRVVKLSCTCIISRIFLLHEFCLVAMILVLLKSTWQFLFSQYLSKAAFATTKSVLLIDNSSLNVFCIYIRDIIAITGIYIGIYMYWSCGFVMSIVVLYCKGFGLLIVYFLSSELARVIALYSVLLMTTCLCMLGWLELYLKCHLDGIGWLYNFVRIVYFYDLFHHTNSCLLLYYSTFSL